MWPWWLKKVHRRSVCRAVRPCLVQLHVGAQVTILDHLSWHLHGFIFLVLWSHLRTEEAFFKAAGSFHQVYNIHSNTGEVVRRCFSKVFPGPCVVDATTHHQTSFLPALFWRPIQVKGVVNSHSSFKIGSANSLSACSLSSLVSGFQIWQGPLLL